MTYMKVNKKMPPGFVKMATMCKPQFMPSEQKTEPAPLHPKTKEIIERVRQKLRERSLIVNQTRLAHDCRMEQGSLSKILREPTEDEEKKKNERWKDPARVYLNALLWAWEGSGNKLEDFIPSEILPVPLAIQKIQREEKDSLLVMFIELLSNRIFENDLERNAFEGIEDGINKMFERTRKKIEKSA